MHRDDLAGLGESLRRELQDLVVGGPAALADLEADARRLLALLDGDLRELGDWLTSPAIEVDLPEEADEAPETAAAPESVAAARRAPERGAREADGQGLAGTGREGAPPDWAAPERRDEPPAGGFAPVKSLRDLAQWVRETSVGEPARLEWENPPLSVGAGPQDRPLERPLPPGIEIPGDLRPPLAGASKEGPDGTAAGSPGFQSRAAKG